MSRSRESEDAGAGRAAQAAERPEVAMPPAPPGESSLEAVHKTQAVVEALSQLGGQADPKRVAQAVKSQSGIECDPGEVATIMSTLRERAATPPPLDQPPPQEARRPIVDQEATDLQRRPAMRVKEVMTPGVQIIDPDSTLQEAAAKMKARDIGPLPVCDGDRLVGMLTDRDITVRATAEGENPSLIRVRDVMTEGVLYCFEDQLVEEAARLMQEYQVRRLVVVNQDKRLVGIVSLGDLAVQTRDEELAGQTLEQISEQTPPLEPGGPR